jgi:hypothetical protein
VTSVISVVKYSCLLRPAYSRNLLPSGCLLGGVHELTMSLNKTMFMVMKETMIHISEANAGSSAWHGFSGSGSPAYFVVGAVADVASRSF